MATAATKPRAGGVTPPAPKLVPVFVLDEQGLTDIYDQNGVPVGKALKHGIYAVLDNHPDLGGKLHTPSNGTFYPAEIDNAVATYAAHTATVPPPPANDEADDDEVVDRKKPKSKRKSSKKKKDD